MKCESAAAVIPTRTSSSLTRAASISAGPAEATTSTGSPQIKTPLEKGYGRINLSQLAKVFFLRR